MKRHKSALIVVLYIAFLVTGYYLWELWGKRPPAIPSTSETVEISLRDPGSGRVIVEKTIEDKTAIGNLAALFSRGQTYRDHKCASIGEISFIGKTGSKMLEVLPGHDSGKFEFRFEGRMFTLPRDEYIAGLVASGIDAGDVRLDGHP